MEGERERGKSVCVGGGGERERERERERENDRQRLSHRQTDRQTKGSSKHYSVQLPFLPNAIILFLIVIHACSVEM